jgi:hypothetical protein
VAEPGLLNTVRSVLRVERIEVRPTSKDAYARLMVLKFVVVHAISTPRHIISDLFAAWSEAERKTFDDQCRAQAQSNLARLKELRLWGHASPKERQFLRSFGSQMDEYAHKAATWRMECIGIILWALGLVDSWPVIDQQIDPELLKMIPIEKMGLFSKHPSLRARNEIAAKRDLIEFWHWRVRTRQLIEEGRLLEPDESMKQAGLTSYDDIVRFSAKAGYEKGALPEPIDEDFVFLGKPFRSLPVDEYEMATSIIVERHSALNWLCGMAPGNRWDDTPTDT